jgi:hypothetical protein
MSAQIVPVTSFPNQTLQPTLNVDGKTLVLNLALSFNEAGAYWVMQIKDSAGTLILDSIPLLVGQPPATNILGQFAYLGIGSAYVVNVTGVAMDSPDDTNLGTDFLLIWSDSPGYVA